jgi:hypothetical protein
MKNTVIAGWASAILALITMLIGHMGKHNLNWMSYHISTFAANAPNDTWITSSMLMSAVSLLCIGVLISKYQLLGTNYFTHLLPLLIGAAISGLIMLATFEETARTLKALKHMSFSAIRQQSFHDAGLMIFFYCSICLTIMAGFFCMIFRKGKEKILGIIITSLGPASFFLMTTSWPKFIGINGHSAGLKQRASLLCIWIAMALLLLLALKRIGTPITERASQTTTHSGPVWDDSADKATAGPGKNRPSEIK